MEQQAARQPQSSLQEATGFADPSLSLVAEMVHVPAGSFIMGSPASEVDSLLQYYTGVPRDLFLNEIGVHTVVLPSFLIDRFPVSNAQFRHFITTGGYERQEWWSPAGWRWRTKTGRNAPRFWRQKETLLDAHPVVGISWYEADAYARSVNKRLPTEAEWEKAARGLEARRYPWGNTFELNRCNTADFWLHREILEYEDWHANFFLRRLWREQVLTTPINSFPQGASPYGVLNMGGNVWEWCADWYATDYYAHSPSDNPQGAEYGSEKVCRGGSFGYFGWSVRATDRGHHPPSHYSLGLGMRCVRDV